MNTRVMFAFALAIAATHSGARLSMPKSFDIQQLYDAWDRQRSALVANVDGFPDQRSKALDRVADLLIRFGIPSHFAGSVCYGVFVPDQDAERAIQILSDSRKYWSFEYFTVYADPIRH